MNVPERWRDYAQAAVVVLAGGSVLVSIFASLIRAIRLAIGL